MLLPWPVVVDADVLYRNVDFALCRGLPGMLIGQGQSRLLFAYRGKPLRGDRGAIGDDPPLARHREASEDDDRCRGASVEPAHCSSGGIRRASAALVERRPA